MLYHVVQLPPVPTSGPTVPRHDELVVFRATEWRSWASCPASFSLEGTSASRKVRLFYPRSALLVADA